MRWAMEHLLFSFTLYHQKLNKNATKGWHLSGGIKALLAMITLRGGNSAQLTG